MQSKLLAALGVAILLAVTAPIPGCFSAGQSARDQVAEQVLGFPAEGVLEDAQRGVDILADAGQVDLAEAEVILSSFRAAISSGDREQIREGAIRFWPEVASYALGGIDAREARGDIGPGVAVSLRERVAQFERTLFKVGE